MDGIVEVMLNAVFERPGGEGIQVPQFDEQKDLSVLHVQMVHTSEPEPSQMDQLIKSTMMSGVQIGSNSCYDHQDIVVPFCTILPPREAFFVDILMFCWKWIKCMDFPLKLAYSGPELSTWRDVWARTRIPVVETIHQCDVLMVDTLEKPPTIQELTQIHPRVYIELFDIQLLHRYSRLSTVFESCWIISSPHSGFPYGRFHFIGIHFQTSQKKQVVTPYLSIYQQACVRLHRSIQRLEWIQLYKKTERSKFTNQVAFQKREDEIAAFLNTFKPPPSPSYNPTSPQQSYHPTSPIPELVL
jgi:hypothetical protein